MRRLCDRSCRCSQHPRWCLQNFSRSLPALSRGFPTDTQPTWLLSEAQSEWPRPICNQSPFRMSVLSPTGTRGLMQERSFPAESQSTQHTRLARQLLVHSCPSSHVCPSPTSSSSIPLLGQTQLPRTPGLVMTPRPWWGVREGGGSKEPRGEEQTPKDRPPPSSFLAHLRVPPLWVWNAPAHHPYLENPHLHPTEPQGSGVAMFIKYCPVEAMLAFLGLPAHLLWVRKVKGPS